MSQTEVITLTSAQLQTMQQTLNEFLLNRKVPYSEFTAKIRHTTITAYTSGKVVFQGDEAKAIASNWQSPSSGKKQETKTAVSSSLPDNLSTLSAIGSDEVGNGSYFGPVTVCAAYVAKQQLLELKKMGVKDSKALTDPQIIELAKKLKQVIRYRLLIVEPEKYNQIQPKYNAVHMKVSLHNQAIYLLLKDLAPVKPEAIIIDQFTPEKNYKKYVKGEANQVVEPLLFTTKGEQHHLAVAAASIISRAAFLEELKKESIELGFSVPSGAGSRSDKVAAKLLAIGGIELLQKYAKLHFANTEKAKKLVRP